MDAHGGKLPRLETCNTARFLPLRTVIAAFMKIEREGEGGRREREREGGREREREGERERERGKCKPEFLLLTFPSGSSGESKVLRKSAKACSSVHFPLATFGCFLTLYTLQQKQSTHTHFEHSLILDHIHYAFIRVTPQKNYSTKCRIVGLVKVF